MQNHSQKEERKILSYLLLLMLLLHGALLVTNIQTLPEESDEAVMRVTLRDEEVTKKRQIVRSEESERQTPVDDAYLSDKDRSFDRQTRARRVDLFEKAAKGNSQVDVKKKTSSAKKKAPKDVKLSDLGAQAGHPDPFKEAAQEYAQAKKGTKNGDAASRGISSTNDYVEEVPVGDLTQLNTVEYKYYGYYLRIRQKLEQFWGRSIQEKAEEIFQNGRRLPASENFITALEITMDGSGKIIDIKVRGSSGVKELDEAAVESFNQAGPFPNPPRGLVVNGRVKIEWGFVVQS